MQQPERKVLVFVGSSQKDLRKFPKAVRKDIGYDLDAVQCGQMSMTAKRLKDLPGVMELIERYDKDTYRTVYVVISKTRFMCCTASRNRQSVGYKHRKKIWTLSGND